MDGFQNSMVVHGATELTCSCKGLLAEQERNAIHKKLQGSRCNNGHMSYAQCSHTISHFRLIAAAECTETMHSTFAEIH